MSQVAILGCGPAGLLAAHAVGRAGLQPVIYSNRIKSQMPGAVFLHRSIPDIHKSGGAPEFKIEIIKSGVRQGYAYNVYGNIEADVSWNKFNAGKEVPAWSLSNTYDRLWGWYESSIINMNLTQGDIGSICNNFPLVLSTIPAKSICGNLQHQFRWQDIWIKYMYGGLLSGINDNNMIYYNGCPKDENVANQLGTLIGPPWYRYSQINGHRAWEYSRDPVHEQGMAVSTGYKPRGTNCDCWLAYGNFFRLGRFGKWKPGVLTHHAFEGAERALEVCSALL